MRASKRIILLSGGVGGGGGGGGGGTRVRLTAQNISKTVAGPTTVVVSYLITNTGLVKDHTGTTLETWKITGVVADYEVRATLNTGTSTTGSALGSWLGCGTTREWDLTGVNTLVTCQLTVELRDASTLVVLASATISMSADGSP